jgi:hypothetical protein
MPVPIVLGDEGASEAFRDVAAGEVARGLIVV